MIGALRYCICGASGYVATSPDAVAWSTAATGTTNQMYTVVRGPDRFVVFGGFRCIHIRDSGVLDIYPTTYEFPFSAYYDGTYYWVAANHTTQILRSPDAAAWTLVALPGVSAAVVSVGGEGSKLLVGRDFGYYSFSEDGGITWTTLRLGGNAKWVADVNLGEYILSGFDGVETSPTALFGSWTVASNSIFTAPPRSGTRFGKNGSLIVHSGGGRDYSSDCHRSADNGLSFTLLTAFPGASTGINGDCLFDGERFILTGSRGEIVQLDNEGYEATILANVGVSVQGIAYHVPNAETPAITPATGHSAGPVTAKVSCATAGADIHYTTDGSTPTESSPVLHDGGIVLGSWTSPAVTLKVMASASGHHSSGISTATYQFTAQAPMVSLQMKPESGYFFSEAESRKPRVLGASGKGIFAGTIQWELLDSEWPMFLDWWEDKHKGVNPFNIYCCTGAEPLLHTFQAVGPYEVVRDTGVRKVTLPVKITMRPTGLYSGWGSFLGGPPVAYPVIVPMPQWGFQREEAAVFLSTTGAPTAARPVATRGELLSLEWKALTGMQFDVLVDWWSTYLGQGRRKFTISLPGETGPLLCQLVEDPAFTVEGVHFRGSMKVFAAPVRTLAPPPA